MKSMMFAVGVVAALSACAATTGSTAWVKPGVSKVEFGNDVGMCTGFASQHGSGSGVNTAGGVSGKTAGSPSQSSTANPGGGAGTVAGGTYQGMASSDYAQRAATQQRAQEMAARRAQAEAYGGCLTERGYKQITLTPEQSARLATLKAGTNEYYEFLYAIASAPGGAAKP
jgi:hypothetical protein